MPCILIWDLAFLPSAVQSEKEAVEQEQILINIELAKAADRHAAYRELTTGPHPILEERKATRNHFSLQRNYPTSPNWLELPPGFQHIYWIGNEYGTWVYHIGVALDKKGEVVAYRTSLVYTRSGNF